MKRFYLAALMCAALSFAGCDKNSGSEPEPEPPVEYDVTMEASAFYGFYYGQKFGNNMEYNYVVYLSDSDTFRPDNDHYYTFDIFSNEADPENIKLPAGTYTLGVSGETAAGTFSPDNSLYMDNTEGGGIFMFESGKIVVSYDGDNIVVDATLVDGAGYSHHVTYTGPCSIINKDSSGSEPEPPVEYDVTMEASAFYGNYFGQKFENNMEYNYVVNLSDSDTFRPENDHYYLSNEGAADPENIKLPAGTYTLGVSGETAAGTFTHDSSFYMDNTKALRFSFKSGEIVVSYDGDNIVVDATLVDNAGYSHHVTYTGPCIFE